MSEAPADPEEAFLDACCRAIVQRQPRTLRALLHNAPDRLTDPMDLGWLCDIAIVRLKPGCLRALLDTRPAALRGARERAMACGQAVTLGSSACLRVLLQQRPLRNARLRMLMRLARERNQVTCMCVLQRACARGWGRR